jgi:hypothetical protein
VRHLILLLLVTACAIHPSTRTIFPCPNPDPQPEVILSRDSEGRKVEDISNLEDRSFDTVIFQKAFKKYLKNTNECPEEPGELDEAFEAGYFTPGIVSALGGSFSRPGAKQQLYIVFIGECGATHSEHWGTRRLLLLENGKILINSKYFWDSAEHPMDLDGDGKEEWVATSVFCNQGSCTEEAAIAKIIDSDFQAILDLGSVFEDSCDVPANPTGLKKWAQITAQDGHLHKSWQEMKCHVR